MESGEETVQFGSLASAQMQSEYHPFHQKGRLRWPLVKFGAGQRIYVSRQNDSVIVVDGARWECEGRRVKKDHCQA